MKKCLFTFTIFLLIAFAALSSFAADFMIGEKINVTGNIVMPGCIEWGDGSTQCGFSAADTTSIWGNISGILANQTDLWNALLLKEDKVNKGVINGYASLDSSGKVPLSQLPPIGSSSTITTKRLTSADFVSTWYTQGAIWETFSPDFSLLFTKLTDTTRLRLDWSDNIGIYNPNWCNVGLFLDDALTPVCAGAWSGVPDTTIFNQQFLNCVVESVPPGQHTITVKHRSQYCMYGNYAFDDSGLNRFVSVEEF